MVPDPPAACPVVPASLEDHPLVCDPSMDGLVVPELTTEVSIVSDFPPYDPFVPDPLGKTAF